MRGGREKSGEDMSDYISIWDNGSLILQLKN